MSRSIFTIVLVLLLFGGVTAGIIKVPENYATIQAGIDAAVKGDTALVSAGTYYENINFKGKAITVASYFIAEGDTDYINSTIIDGSRPSDPNKGSVVSFTSGEDTTSVICGFTITRGTGTLYDSNNRVGGGIYCKNSAARISHNKIVNNSVIYNQSNKSCFGGGIGLWPYQNPHHVIIEDNLIESNSVTAGNISWGGGIFLIKGKILHNIIRQNISTAYSSLGHGGGISATCDNINNRPLVIIAENTITSNQAFSNSKTIEYPTLGGGVDIQYNNIRLINNTITHNLVGLVGGTSNQRIQGGGVRIWGVKDSALVQDNTISFNSFSGNGICAGGGLHVSNSDLSAKPAKVTIKGNRFEGNKGVWGGGLRTAHNPGCIVSDNEFIGNFATNGGGICDYDSNPFTISNNLFRQNQATNWGGGLNVEDSDALIVNNIFTQNESRYGGGVLIDQYARTKTFTAQIINNTMTENVAASAGAIGIWYFKKAVSMNNICWGNSTPIGPEILVRGGELNVAHSDIEGGAANIVIEENGKVNWLAGNINTNPLFEFSGYQLSKFSPCIGAGTESILIGGTTYSCPVTDIAGNPRPNPAESTTPDIGAYESPLDKPSGPILVPEQYASIQAGINAAKDGDLVLVRDNTYYENINFKGKAITVASYFLMDWDTTHINNTIIDGSKPSHADSGSVVFFISGEDTTSVLCGFTITGGTGTETTEAANGIITPCRAGGGIFCYDAVARIINNKIINNTVNSLDKEVLGGGLIALPFGSNAWIVLKDNQISRNTIKTTTGAAFGGGLEIGCNLIMRNNLISYNSVVHNATDNQAGGGGFDCSTYSNDLRTVIIESNRITHNSVVSYSNVVGGPSAFSGGVCIWGKYQGRFSKNEVSLNELWANNTKNASGSGIMVGEVTDLFVLEGNVIQENAVKQGNGWGGGVNIHSGASPVVINNIIDGNIATNGGAVLIGGSSTAKLINNTIINNHASFGGAIYLTGSSIVYLMNTIVWANQAATHVAIHIVSGTVQAAYCDIQGGWSGAMNINTDPLFADTLFHLSDNSPCIGKGIASFDFGGGLICHSPETDIAGKSRPDPAGSNPDIGAYESPLDKPTKVSDLPLVEIPKAYFLAQNYPNPFNPSTTIEFALPKSAFVTLKIYNLLGEDVATLVAEQREAGIHKLNWDASGLASGVYLYRMEAGNFVQSKKLILMR